MQNSEQIFAAVYQQERTKKLGWLGQRIMQLLTPQHRLLFLEYERQAGLMQGNQIEKAYQIGLEDGRLRPTICQTKF